MKNLNVTESNETKESLFLGSKRINLNYYPICPDPELTVGVGRHSDVSTTLTVLLQGGIGGLYVRRDNDSWIHVPLVNGSIVINVGDALQIMSGEKATTDKISYFPEVLSSGEKAVYKEVLCSDYANHFFRKALGGKKNSRFRKNMVCNLF